MTWLLALATLLPATSLAAGSDETVPASASGAAAVAEGGGAAAPERPESPQEMLLGVIVRGEEVAVIDLYWDGDEFLIPIERFREFCQCEVQETRDGLRVVTPIGTATLGADYAAVRGTTRYLLASAMPQRLAMPYEYDPRRMALVLEIPWAGLRPSREQMLELEPEVAAPALSLSYASTGAVYSRQGDTGTGSASALFMGRFANGQWRARLDQTLARGPGLEEYGWVRGLGDQSLMLLGHQRLDLHPLLDPLELTGGQAAWTNAPLSVFGQGRSAGELLPRQLSTRTTISGHGVPAGLAVLRVDDRRIATAIIDLSGYYEFVSVQIPTTGRRVEVLIYDRQNPTVPVDIQEHSRRASDALLPAGAAVLQGAAGAAGNPIGPAQTQANGFAGFAQGRYGVSSRLTLESTVQQGFGGTSAMAGGVAQLGQGFVASVAGGLSRGAFGYQAELDGDLSRWRIRARSLEQAEGYRYVGAPHLRDHYAEVTHLVGERLEVGVIGRRQTGFGGEVAFVLPSLAWHPSARFMVRARPDGFGQYRLDLNWLPGGRWRFGVTRSGHFTTGMVANQLSRSLRGQIVGEFDDLGGHRQAAVVTWVGRGRFSPAITGGPLLTNGKPGVLLSAQAELLPGVLLGARYESASLLGSAFGGRDQRVSLTLSTRHAVAGRRLVPAGTPLGNRRVGSIAGRIRVPEGFNVDPGDLRNMTIRLNGRGAARTRRNGSFLIPDLEPGVYRVELDADRLPIELTARERAVLVEVAAGSVSDIEFRLDVEYGMAGRVRIGAANAPGVLLEIVDTTGAVVAATRTDRWGLYRVDGLRAGRYQVRVAAANAPELDIDWPARAVQLSDDFLFDQDLELVAALTDRLPASGGATGDPVADVSAPVQPGKGSGTPAAAAPMAPEGPVPPPGTATAPVSTEDEAPERTMSRGAPVEDLDFGFAGHVLDQVTVSAPMPPLDLVPMLHAGIRARPLVPPSAGASATVVAWAPPLDLVPPMLPLGGVAVPGLRADARPSLRVAPSVTVPADPPSPPPPAVPDAGRRSWPSPPGPVAREHDLSTPDSKDGDDTEPVRRPPPLARYWGAGSRWRHSPVRAVSGRGRRRREEADAEGGGRGSRRRRPGADRDAVRAAGVPTRQPSGRCADPGT